MVRTIAICNQKGGTGKTTTAINISALLALAGQKVLLVDLDPQGNTTSGLGIDKQKITKSLYNVLIEDLELREIVLNTQVAGLSLAPSNVHLSGAEIELVAQMNRENRLNKALSFLKDSFDFIIIDCPPSLGLLTVNALTAADSVLVPVQCEYYALEGLTQLINTVELVKNNLNSKLAIEGVLLTMADYRTNLTKEVIQEARNFFKEKIYKTVIPRNIRLSEAPSFGKPIFLYDRDSIGSQKYWELCCEILGKDKEEFIMPATKKAEEKKDQVTAQSEV